MEHPQDLHKEAALLEHRSTVMVDVMGRAGAVPVFPEAAKLQALSGKACCQQMSPCEVEHDWQFLIRLIGLPIILYTTSIMPGMLVHALALVHLSFLWGNMEMHCGKMSASSLERKCLSWLALE